MTKKEYTDMLMYALKDERKGTEFYLQFLDSIPNMPEFLDVANILDHIIRDEQKHMELLEGLLKAVQYA